MCNLSQYIKEEGILQGRKGRKGRRKLDIAKKNEGKRIFYERNRRINRNPSTLELHTENLFVCLYTKRFQ